MVKIILGLLARLLIGALFILSGLSKVGDSSGSIQFISSSGLPLASVLHHLAVIVEIAGGAMIIVGFRTRLAAFALILFLIPVTGVFHYLPAIDPAASLVQKSMQFIQVSKNLAIIGGLLLFAIHGAGPISLSHEK